MFSKLWHLAKIIWKHGGVPKLWFVATGVAAFSSKIDEWTGFKVRDQLPDWFPDPAWWWGLVVLSIWVIYSLANRVLRYETPTLNVVVVQDNRDKSWWLEIRNEGSKPLNSCAVDFECIENAAGERVFPFSLGLARPEGKSNPFPLRATQPKQGRFAALEEGKIVFYATDINRKLTSYVLAEDRYVFTIGAYSEAEGAQCKKTITLLRDNQELRVI